MIHSRSACIHTDDKKYTQTPLLESAFSSVNIGEHKLRTNTDALNNRVWEESEPVYWQMDSDYDHLTYEEQIKIIKFAFLEPSLISKLRIRQKRRQTDDAHIKINWVGPEDEKLFRDRTSVLAFAYGPQRGIGGDITMNASKLWLLRNTPLSGREALEKGYVERVENPNSNLRYYDPLHTMKHEGGHALGMRHIEDVAERFRTVMYPYYNGIRKFSPADLDYFFTLYARIGSWERAIRAFEHRLLHRF